MPNLQQLIEELAELRVSPKDIRITPTEYDSYMSDGETVADEDK